MIRKRIPLTYASYAKSADDCDLALWRPRPIGLNPMTWFSFGRYVTRYTGGPYSHASGVVFWKEVDRWMSCGYEEGRGGFAEPLDVAVQRHCGLIDIWRVKATVWDQSRASHSCVAKRLGQDLGWPYKWRSIRLLASPLLPIVGFFMPQREHVALVEKVTGETREGICSEHVARSFAACGIELCNKAASSVTPNDLMASYATEYVCTLYWKLP